MIQPDIPLDIADAISDVDVASIKVLKAGCAPEGKQPVAMGIVQFDCPALRWRLRIGAVVHVLDGAFRVLTYTGPSEARVGETVWLPPGTHVSLAAGSARAFFAAYPHHWRDALVPYE